MHQVDYQTLIDKTGFVYRAIIVTSIRARQLTRRASPVVPTSLEDKVVDIALRELCADKIKYQVIINDKESKDIYDAFMQFHKMPQGEIPPDFKVEAVSHSETPDDQHNDKD